jgi:cytochrome c biogenesis protein CcmG/thiol:disulfide interchange protein DsbE
MKTLAIVLFNCFVLLSANTAQAEIAPGFSLQNAEAETVSLSDFAGQPLVLNFWATWCPYCRKLQPGLQDLQKQYAASGLVVLGISFREDEGVKPQDVLDNRGHSYMTLVDGDAVATHYGVKGTPTTFFIDRQGNIVGRTSTSDIEDPVWGEGVGLIVN